MVNFLTKVHTKIYIFTLIINFMSKLQHSYNEISSMSSGDNAFKQEPLNVSSISDKCKHRSFSLPRTSFTKNFSLQFSVILCSLILSIFPQCFTMNFNCGTPTAI